MMILIFAQLRHVPHVTNVVQRQVGTGLLGKMVRRALFIAVRFTEIIRIEFELVFSRRCKRFWS